LILTSSYAPFPRSQLTFCILFCILLLHMMDLPPGLPVRISPAIRDISIQDSIKVFCYCYLPPYNGGRHSIGRTTRREHFEKCRQQRVPFDEQEANIYQQHPEFQYPAEEYNGDNEDNGMPYINELFIEEQNGDDPVGNGLEYGGDHISYGVYIVLNLILLNF
jgi:hypothetical protein